jgi:uncharacterized protein YecE (DUF72 family)
MHGAVHIGTSGYHYKHWKGPFYPERLPASRMLEYYQQRFDTVELNNTFYRLPAETTLHNWRDSTPPGFCFAVKGSRFLTHMKKLKDSEAGLEKFLSRVEILGPKLGPILFQLPPWWEVDAERLEGFLRLLPRRHRFGFELRNQTWHIRHVFELLEHYNAAFCIYELSGQRSGVEVTADFAYVRLHGPGRAYQGSYTPEMLETWTRRIRAWKRTLQAIFVYFDNDQAGYAVDNAIHLKKLV